MVEVVARGWTLSHSPPPYTQELPLPDPPRRPHFYSLLILDLPAKQADALGGLPEPIDGLRRQLVMPVFVRLAVPPTHPLTLTLRDVLASAGGELLLAGDSIGRRALEVLTVRRNLASDWLGWLRLHREIGPNQKSVIRALVNHTRSDAFVDEILQEAGISPRSARYWLETADLPPPRTYARGSRLLRTLLSLQRDPNLDAYDAALAIGYSSSESLSNAFFRYFGHGAQNGRRFLGLERRFHEFDVRNARFRS